MLRGFITAGIMFAGITTVAAAQESVGPIRTGTYDLEILFGGGVMEGALTLTASGDSLVAALMVSNHPSPVRAGEQDRNRLTLVSTSAAMDVGYSLEFSGDDVSGTFRYNGQDGSVTGKRRGGRD